MKIQHAYSIFLDDYREPKGVTWVDLPLLDWTIIRNYDDFVRAVTSFGPPKVVSFDNDLEDAHYQEYFRAMEAGAWFDYESRAFTMKTGWHCAVWLKQYCIKNDFKYPEVFVHSKNKFAQIDIPKLFKKET